MRNQVLEVFKEEGYDTNIKEGEKVKTELRFLSLPLH